VASSSIEKDGEVHWSVVLHRLALHAPTLLTLLLVARHNRMTREPFFTNSTT
jgi:hypothetical protein